MKVNIKIATKKKYGIKGNEIDFEELERKIRLSVTKDLFDKTVESAKKSGLSKMTLSEIDNEVKSYRKGA